MDIKGIISKYSYYSWLIIIQVISKLYILIKAELFGIKLGKKCKFWGNSVFFRKPNSQITIGNYCSFRSLSASNLIGINHKCILSTQSQNATIKIGDNCHFSGTTISAFKSIKIGNNVMCGANTIITDGDWHTNDYRTGDSKEVVIHDNVWLGLNVIVWKGVSIGENSFIGANSLITKDIPANVVAAGNPCKIIRTLDVK